MLAEGQKVYLYDYQGNIHRQYEATISGNKVVYKGRRHSLSALAAGWSCVITGFALREKLARRFKVSCDSLSKVGRALKAASRSWLRRAVVAKTIPELRISP